MVHSEEDCHRTTQLTKVRPANHDLLEGRIIEHGRGENVRKVILQIAGLVHQDRDEILVEKWVHRWPNRANEYAGMSQMNLRVEKTTQAPYHTALPKLLKPCMVLWMDSLAT